MPDELDISCRCMGSDRRTKCEQDATQEDGLCDTCRCPHGCCSNHGDDAAFDPMLWYRDPMAWVEWFSVAQQEKTECLVNRGFLEQEAE